jgi:hypothetical protein
MRIVFISVNQKLTTRTNLSNQDPIRTLTNLRGEFVVASEGEHVTSIRHHPLVTLKVAPEKNLA